MTQRIHDPSEAAEQIRAACKTEQECFVVFLLDARQHVLKTVCVAIGTLDVRPREVFRDAIRTCAHSIIMGHNRPFGDTEPSEADVELTDRLVQAGKLLGIPVLDHVIVTSDDFMSLSEHGFILDSPMEAFWRSLTPL